MANSPALDLEAEFEKRLTRADSLANPIEDSQYAWALILNLAIKDGASEVRFDPSRGDESLVYKVGENWHTMAPPPPAYHQAMLDRIRVLARPVTWRTRLAVGLHRVARALEGELSSEHPFVIKVDSAYAGACVRFETTQQPLRVVIGLDPNESTGRLAYELALRFGNLRQPDSAPDDQPLANR